MSGIIRTVTGDIKTEELGYCHAHEHLMVRKGGPYESFDVNLVIDDVKKSLKEVESFAEIGGKSIVDAQPVGAGRKPKDLKVLSEKSGINIIASTGFHMRKFYPETSRIFALNSEEAKELFSVELLAGMFDGMDPDFDAEVTGIKAGQIKTALSKPEEFEIYRNLFDGATAAANAIGAPIMTHTEKGADIIAFLDYLDSRHVDMDRVIICHLDRTCPDVNVHKEVARRGAFLDYDTVARYKYHDDETECHIIKEMLDAGYESNLLLGLDTTAARLESYGGTPGLTFIKEKFEDIAESYGIQKKSFTKFMIDNPARAFRFGK